MHKIRIIPRLDIKGPNLVKGIHLEGLRVLGNPEFFSSYYYENGADEIFYMDCVASLYERNSLNTIISKTSEKMFIPMTVGGGIRSIDDIREVLKSGADKICINTAAIKNPEIIREASRLFGSSTIVIAIEAIKQSKGKYEAFIDNGREYTGKDVFEWAKQVEELGAGEIVITSVDKEGTSEGFDLELIKKIRLASQIPIVAHGGASSVDNVCDMILETGADAVCVASALHYDLLKSGKLSRAFANSTEGNTSFLNSGRDYSKIKTFSLQDLKSRMIERGISCRNNL